MDPLLIAAQFAAYTWFAQTHADATNDEAIDYALRHGSDFLGQAPEGLGKLLIRVGRLKPRRARPKHAALCRSAAG